MSPIDYRSTKLSKPEARKLITEIATRFPYNVRFSGHALREMAADAMTIGDARNLMKSSDSRIVEEGELKDGSWRYRLKTNRMVLVIAFVSETALNVVTAWRRKGL
jgi:hypothetical protein